MFTKKIFLLVIVIGIVPALYADDTCTAAIIKGAYGFSGFGIDMAHGSGSQSSRQRSPSMEGYRSLGRNAFRVLYCEWQWAQARMWSMPTVPA